MRTTEFAPALPPEEPASRQSPAPTTSYGPPPFASTWKLGHLQGQDFVLQPDGTLRCPPDHPLSPQERRPERDGTLRVVYAARIGDCRPCPLRQQCQWHGTSTQKPRRVSVVLHPIIALSPLNETPTVQDALHPILWGDWPRRFHRRELIKLLRCQQVTIQHAETSPPTQSPPPRPLSRPERAHWRLSWQDASGSQCRFGSSTFRLDHPLWDPRRLCCCPGLTDTLTPHTRAVLGLFFPRSGSRWSGSSCFLFLSRLLFFPALLVRPLLLPTQPHLSGEETVTFLPH